MDPLTIALIGSSLLGLFGAKKSSDAAKKAAETQVESGRETLDFLRGLYDQQRSDFMPYMDTGRGAVVTLSGLLGRDPFAYAGDYGTSTTPLDQRAPASRAPLPAARPPAAVAQPRTADIGRGVRVTYPPESMPAEPTLRAMQAGGSVGAVPAHAGMILMRHGVSGDERWVPAAREREYVAQGARRVR